MQESIQQYDIPTIDNPDKKREIVGGGGRVIGMVYFVQQEILSVCVTIEHVM